MKTLKQHGATCMDDTVPKETAEKLLACSFSREGLAEAAEIAGCPVMLAVTDRSSVSPLQVLLPEGTLPWIDDDGSIKGVAPDGKWAGLSYGEQCDAFDELASQAVLLYLVAENVYKILEKW